MKITLEWNNGKKEEISVKQNETILDTAEKNDINLPFGCKTGACSTCTGKLIKGEITHKKPPKSLKEKHLKNGYILLCIAQPKTDCHIKVGYNIQTELTKNPWKNKQK